MDGLYAHFFPGKKFVGEWKMEVISIVRAHQSRSNLDGIIKIPNFLDCHSALGDVNAMKKLFGPDGPLRLEFDGIKYVDYQSV